MKFFFCVLIMTLCGALGALFLKTGAVRIVLFSRHRKFGSAAVFILRVH